MSGCFPIKPFFAVSFKTLRHFAFRSFLQTLDTRIFIPSLVAAVDLDVVIVLIESERVLLGQALSQRCFRVYGDTVLIITLVVIAHNILVIVLQFTSLYPLLD